MGLRHRRPVRLARSGAVPSPRRARCAWIAGARLSRGRVRADAVDARACRSPACASASLVIALPLALFATTASRRSRGAGRRRTLVDGAASRTSLARRFTRRSRGPRGCCGGCWSRCSRCGSRCSASMSRANRCIRGTRGCSGRPRRGSGTSSAGSLRSRGATPGSPAMAPSTSTRRPTTRRPSRCCRSGPTSCSAAGTTR